MCRSIIGLLQRAQRKKEIGIIKLNKKFKPGVRKHPAILLYQKNHPDRSGGVTKDIKTIGRHFVKKCSQFFIKNDTFGLKVS